MGKISDRLKRAKEGKIVTVPFIHPKLRKYIFIGKNMYHLIGGAGGSGKCLAKGTKVIMSDGSLKKVENVKKGDLLMGIDSSPREVVNTVSGIDQLFTIDQNNGSSYTVNSSHKVTLKKKYRSGRTEILNVEAKELYNNSDKYKNDHYGFKVPVEFEEKEVPLDPYLLGLWLGDGSNSKALITNPEEEIREYLIEECKKLGFTPNIDNRNNCDHISLVAPGKQVRNITKNETFSSVREATEYYGISHQEYVSRACTQGKIVDGCEWEHLEGNHYISETLKSLNLYHNKHIPHIYLCNSKNYRLKLLAGIIDSDGYKNPQNNCYEITTVYKQFSEDIIYLIRSLGFKATVKKRKQDIIIGDKEYKDYGSYRIHFTGDIEIPCLVERKKPKSKTKYRKLNTGITISKKEIGEYYGFTLAGKDHYFLLEDFTVTHNSSWVDYNYVLYVNNWYKNLENPDFKLKIIVRSMERSKENRIGKWICMRLYQKHGILIDTNSISGWNVDKSKIDSNLISLVETEEANLERELSDNVEIIDGIDHPTSIFMQLKNEALSKGKLYQYEKVNNTETLFQSYKGKKIKVSPEACPQASPFQPVYIPDDPNEITIFIIDHLQAMKRERGFTDKENLDKMSEYARILRDLFGFTPVIVNQLNRGIADTYRKVKTDLLPQDSDFSGSSSMYQDADMAGILFNPYKYGLNKLADWDMKRCVDEFGINRFRSFHLLKNTYGPDNQMFGYQFIGENGIFNELPNQVNDYHPIAYPKHKQKITNYI